MQKLIILFLDPEVSTFDNAHYVHEPKLDLEYEETPDVEDIGIENIDIGHKEIEIPASVSLSSSKGSKTSLKRPLAEANISG